MADEIEIHWMVDLPANQALERWRSDPPAVIPKYDFKIVDESYNSLSYEHKYLDWPQKITIAGSLGVALLFKGFMQSVFRFTVRFDEAGPTETRVTLVGTCHPKTRAELEALAEVQGGGEVEGPNPNAWNLPIPGEVDPAHPFGSVKPPAAPKEPAA